MAGNESPAMVLRVAATGASAGAFFPFELLFRHRMRKRPDERAKNSLGTCGMLPPSRSSPEVLYDRWAVRTFDASRVFGQITLSRGPKSRIICTNTPGSGTGSALTQGNP